jgi:hypothetical protein
MQANRCPFLLSVMTLAMQDLHIIERLGRGATSYVFKVSLNKSVEPAIGSQPELAPIQAMKVIDKNNPRYQQISEALTH